MKEINKFDSIDIILGIFEALVFFVCMFLFIKKIIHIHIIQALSIPLLIWGLSGLIRERIWMRNLETCIWKENSYELLTGNKAVNVSIVIMVFAVALFLYGYYLISF